MTNIIIFCYCCKLNIYLQVEKETRDVEVQIDDQINKCLGKIATITVWI